MELQGLKLTMTANTELEYLEMKEGTDRSRDGGLKKTRSKG